MYISINIGFFNFLEPLCRRKGGCIRILDNILGNNIVFELIFYIITELVPDGCYDRYLLIFGVELAVLGLFANNMELTDPGEGDGVAGMGIMGGSLKAYFLEL